MVYDGHVWLEISDALMIVQGLCGVFEKEDFPYVSAWSIRLTCDWTIHFGELISCDLPILPQEPPEVIRVSSVKTTQVGLTDVDVLWGCVCVQFLMPLLEEVVFYTLYITPIVPKTHSSIQYPRPEGTNVPPGTALGIPLSVRKKQI